MYKPPHRRNDGVSVKHNAGLSSEWDTHTLEEVVTSFEPAAEKSRVDKDATLEDTLSAVVKRPFDLVPPVLRPPIPWDGTIAISEIVGAMRNVSPGTDAQKLKKGPHKREVRMTSEAPESDQEETFDMDEEIADLIMNSPTTLPTGKLLRVSPSVRKIVMRQLRGMNGRKPPLKSFLVDMWAETAEVVNSDREGVTFSDSVMHVDDLMFNESAFQVLKVAMDGLPAGSIVHRDIVEAYKQDLSPEDQKKITIVASPADSLRSVYLVVNNSGQEVESILDGGSQIVAMDLAVAVGVGLHWDPDTVIHMQSANGLLKKTRGLARNMPFTFGDLTIYLQVHVLDSALYRVLLGRPLDVLTESTIQNYADGYQEL
ncbi:hypothetical protein L218DRAFT_885990, partial [Marasmius fiardii PR-910]